MRQPRSSRTGQRSTVSGGAGTAPGTGSAWATRGVIERDVLIRLGRVLVVIGDYDPAVDALARAISLSSEAGDLEHLALAVAGIARAHRDRGTTAGRARTHHPAS